MPNWPPRSQPTGGQEPDDTAGQARPGPTHLSRCLGSAIVRAVIDRPVAVGVAVVAVGVAFLLAGRPPACGGAPERWAWQAA